MLRDCAPRVFKGSGGYFCMIKIVSGKSVDNIGILLCPLADNPPVLPWKSYKGLEMALGYYNTQHSPYADEKFKYVYEKVNYDLVIV